MDIQASFILTVDELSDGIRRGLRRRLRKFPYLGAGLLALTALAWWADVNPAPLVGVAVIGVMFVFMSPLMGNRLVLRRLVRRNPRLVEERTIRLTEAGYHAIVEGADGHQSWSRVEGVDESDRSWLFQLGPNQVMIVPKRAMTDEDNATFRRFVAEDFPRVSAQPGPGAK